MGLFSFTTCDTDESIPCEFAEHENTGKKVFFLMPDGQPNLEEENYGGYGVFGGVDVYNWLARQNIPIPKYSDPEDIRVAGVYLDSDSFKIYQLGKNFVFYDVSFVLVEHIKTLLTEKFGKIKVKVVKTYAEPVSFFDGKSINDIRDITELLGINTLKISDLMTITHHIKLSFNPVAKYEHEGKSGSCEYQGFMYPEHEEY